MKTYPLTYHDFKQGLEQGKLLGLRCLDCGGCTVPPNAVCTSCGSANLKVESFARKGKIRTFTIIRVAPAGFKPPYLVAMVELQDGPWVVGNLVGVDVSEASMDLIGKDVSVGHQIVPKDPMEAGVDGVALTFALE
jgi:uncharacterized OB-fold protein